MSLISADAHMARQVNSLIKGTGAQFAGKTRGPDHDPEGKRRVPHRLSFDVDAVEAKAKWRRVGDGSVAQGIVHRESLMQTAQELYHEQWKANPAAPAREARAAEQALSAELDAIVASPTPAPIGRAASIRLELGKLKPILEAWRDRLRRVDIDVLAAILRHLEFATGRMFPSEVRIAALAGCHRNSVVEAKRRLKASGLLDWVRRTVKTGNEGEFAPQREQTSNAYEFAPIARMAAGTRQRYLQILTRKLKRLGGVPAAVATAIGAAAEPLVAGAKEMRSAVASLGSWFDNAST